VQLRILHADMLRLRFVQDVERMLRRMAVLRHALPR
jgi:hypothetical protein